MSNIKWITGDADTPSCIKCKAMLINTDKKYCSLQCYYNRKELTRCIICKKIVKSKRRKTCSDNCYQKSMHFSRGKLKMVSNDDILKVLQDVGNIDETAKYFNVHRQSIDRRLKLL